MVFHPFQKGFSRTSHVFFTFYVTVDTQFRTHDLIKENDLNDHPYTPKIMITLHESICLCITCINSFMAYHKNDLEILTVIMVCLVSKSDHRIERYRMIKLHGQHALCLGRVNHT